MAQEDPKVQPDKAAAPLTCGIVMPISAIDGCSAEHWSDVKAIIQESVESITSPKFTSRLVSDADDIGVIQKRIVQGVYTSDVLVCDVSAKNSNVIFELGMRLAFDRPTVIIKDDKTDYSFDTSIIEHIPYPRDLRFSRIVSFKKQLADKVLATYLAAKKSPDHSTFLKNFGTFKVAHLDQKEASGEQVVLEMLSDLQREVSQLRRQPTSRSRVNIDMSEQIALIVKTLIELRRKEPGLQLSADESLVERLVSHNDPDLTRGIPSKAMFTEAVEQACAIARSFP
jgi:hypothetical protein